MIGNKKGHMSAYSILQLLLHLNPLTSFSSMPKLKESVQRSGRDRETQRERERKTERQKDRKTKRQKDKKTERQKDRKTKRQKEC